MEGRVTRARKRTGVGSRRKRADAAPPAPVIAPDENKPICGVKLKTVSAFTMLFALACLAAFMAGRPPASAAAGFASRDGIEKQQEARALRQDDSRRLFRGALRKRKTGAQNMEKSARARTPVGLLPANPKKENEQAKNIGFF